MINDRLCRALQAVDQLQHTSLIAGNALQWYLRRVDRSFDEGDTKYSAAANVYYKASQTQAGQSAVKGIGSVAGTALRLGGSAVKVKQCTHLGQSIRSWLIS